MRSGYSSLRLRVVLYQYAGKSRFEEYCDSLK